MATPNRKPISPELASISPPRNFTVTTEATVRALGVGVPSYAARKRRIEDGVDDLLSFLEEHEAKLRAEGKGDREIAGALEAAARRIDLDALNRLVEHHNRYYPIEADLPIDPRTGAFLLRRGTPFEPELPLDAARLLALYAARSGSERGALGPAPRG